MNTPYVDIVPQSGIVDLPIKFTESCNGSSVHVIHQEWTDYSFPPGSRMIIANNNVAVLIPPNTVIQPNFNGQPIQIKDKIYGKYETSFWK
jgi:hypothetical protein